MKMSTSWTKHSQPAFTCSKLTIETLEKCVKKMFKVQNKDTRTYFSHLFLVFLLLTLNM